MDAGKSAAAAGMKDRDPQWFEARVAALARPATKFANVLVHDFDLAEEIVQEAFARMWASPNMPSEEVHFRRYLYRTITNLSHDYYRRLARRSTSAAPEAEVMNPLEVVQERVNDEAIRAALQILGLRERQAIYLRYFEDQSFAETARIMGSRQVTIRVLVFRALAKLRRHISTNPFSDQVAI
jgi:RNA polymerase sigma factor (sigma-70 family)